MAKPLAAEMVVADLDDELWLERTPLRRALGRPAARPAGRITGEAELSGQFLELLRECRLVLSLDGGGEADMMQQSRAVIEPEQQRADDLLPGDVVAGVAEAAGRSTARRHRSRARLLPPGHPTPQPGRPAAHCNQPGAGVAVDRAGVRRPAWGRSSADVGQSVTGIRAI